MSVLPSLLLLRYKQNKGTPFTSPLVQMFYFGNEQKRLLNRKLKDRQMDMANIDALEERCKAEQASFDDLLEQYHLILASRLLRFKFAAKPALTNDEICYLTGCSTGTYVGMIMGRERKPSKALAEMMSDRLKKLEHKEGLQPIFQPPYPKN